MGNIVLECLRTPDVSKTEISMTREEKVEFQDYERKTTSDEVLKMLISKRLKESLNPKVYNQGKVKVLVF